MRQFPMTPEEAKAEFFSFNFRKGSAVYTLWRGNTRGGKQRWSVLVSPRPGHIVKADIFVAELLSLPQAKQGGIICPAAWFGCPDRIVAAIADALYGQGAGSQVYTTDNPILEHRSLR